MTARVLRKMTGFVLAASAAATLAGPASASPLDDLKGYLSEVEALGDSARDIEKDFRGLAAGEKAKLTAKKDRLKNALNSFKLVGNALKSGKPIPLYITKQSGQVVACGEKIWLHNAAQDKVLRSEYGNENKTLNYIRVNLGWNGKNTLKNGPNITIECKSKSNGQPLLYGDEFTLKIDPDTNRSDGKNLDDGKPYFYPATKAGYDPTVRLGDLGEVKKQNAYWSFRGGEGAVQTGIPAELIASNRDAKGNIGGFCGVGPAGIVPVVRFEMHNHCNQEKLIAAFGAEGLARPPQWMKDLKNEVVSLAKELREDIKKARK